MATTGAGSPRICVVGSANMDLNSYVSRFPREGETIQGHRFEMGYGGKGANQAVMAAKLGGRVSFLAKIGEDVFGKDMLTHFRGQGIDTTQVLTTTQAATGVAAITVNDSGENTIVITPGANDLLAVADVEAARQAIIGAQVLVCQLEIPLDTTLAALRIARSNGVATILNPAPAREDLPEEFLQLSDIFCPNEVETQMLTGAPADTASQAESAARHLRERAGGTIILTLGKRGSLLVTAEDVTLVPSFEVEAVDTTGAGDAFVGSLAFFLARGKSVVDAVQRANRIAAISVQSPGTQASFPVAADLPADLLS